MLSGVYFTRDEKAESAVRPEFVNQYILTDLYLQAKTMPRLRKPILPSIATLVNPLSSLFRICWIFIRAIFLVLLSRLPGSEQAIKKMSVANTAVHYHDGRALATCESGPPLRILLPSLETVGWYNGQRADGEPESEDLEKQDSKKQMLGGDGLLSFMREWTTAHPKVDPETGEMILFHNTTVQPFVHYTIIPSGRASTSPARMNIPLSGISAPKMMHDFGVSRQHTVIMDLPLSLDPTKLLKGRPIIDYDSSSPSRFGVFPRHRPEETRWFETIACCIFHTANTWDVYDQRGDLQSVDLLACRLTSAAVVFTAGNIVGPKPTTRTISNVQRAQRKRHGSFHESSGLERGRDAPHEKTPLLSSSNNEQPDENVADWEDDQCRLYYYSFDMTSSPPENKINAQFALSPVPFEFPSTHPLIQMSSANYIYGCTSTVSSFNPTLGRAALIDCIVKFNARSLIARGQANPPSVHDCVDTRTVNDILIEQEKNNKASGDVQIYRCPPHIYAQEPRFVPRADAQSEDDGYLVFYTFDERQTDEETGEAKPDAISELRIINAKDMRTVVATVQLPARVPYGLHGNWFSEEQVKSQRPVLTTRQAPVQRKRSLRERLGRRFIGAAVWAMGG